MNIIHNSAEFSGKEPWRKSEDLPGVVQSATNMAINNPVLISRHICGLARSKQPFAPIPYTHFSDLVASTTYPVKPFADNLYLLVYPQTFHSWVDGKGRTKQCLSAEDRKAINSLFARFGWKSCLSTSMVRSTDNITSTMDHIPSVVVDVKTMNVPLQIVLDVVDYMRQNDGLVEINGVRLGFINLDLTINFPGAVRPISQDSRQTFVINGRYFVPKTNAHLVGLHCLTYMTIKEGVDVGYEIKVYDKFVHHLETTGAVATNGNNLPNIAYSPHKNIWEAFRNKEIQQHGFGRLEPRFHNIHIVPRTVEGVMVFFAPIYNSLVPYVCHSESFAQTCSWFFNETMHQIALVSKHPSDMDYKVALIRWANKLTCRVHVESCKGLETWDDVLQFLTQTKMPQTSLTVYVEQLEWSNKLQKAFITGYESYYVGQTEYKPNLEFIGLPKADKRVGGGGAYSNAKWTFQNLESLGLNCSSFPFQIHRDKRRLEQVITLEPISEVPDITTKTERKVLIRSWTKNVLQRRNELLAGLSNPSIPKKNQSKAYKFSKMPEYIQVARVRFNKFGDPVIYATDGSYYKPNSSTINMAKHYARAGLPVSTPVFLIRGPRTGTYKNNPVYGEARFWSPANENDCGKLPDCRKYAVLFWDLNDFDRYRDLTY